MKFTQKCNCNLRGLQQLDLLDQNNLSRKYSCWFLDVSCQMDGVDGLYSIHNNL